MKNKKSLIFIIVVILISIALFAAYFLSSQSGSNVVITVDDEEYGTYDLNTDQTIKIELDNGDYNIIQIKDQSVDMIEANCPNQICVNDAPLTKDTPGVIVCLPHKVVVEIKE